MDVMVDGGNCVPSVAPRGATFNPSWHLTRLERRGCNHGVPWAGSLSLGRSSEHRFGRAVSREQLGYPTPLAGVAEPGRFGRNKQFIPHFPFR